MEKWFNIGNHLARLTYIPFKITEKLKQDFIKNYINRYKKCEYNFMPVNMMLLKKNTCQNSLILLGIMCLADKHYCVDIKDFYGLMCSVCCHRII